MEGPFKTNLFQNEVQKVLYKLVLVTYPLDHFRRIQALQTSGLVKKQKNQICSYNNNYVTKD